MKKITKTGISMVLLMALIMFSINFVSAFKNPSSMYCEKMGYQLVLAKTNAGDVSFCKFNENEKCIARDFLIGTCGSKYSYCEKNSYDLKTITDPKKCSSISSSECSVCILDDRSEVEVTKLMGLDLKEENKSSNPLIYIIIVLIIVILVIILFAIKHYKKRK